MTNARLGLMLQIFSLSNQADPYFLDWWSLTAQEKGLFQDSIDKKELKGRSAPGKVAHTKHSVQKW